MAAQVVLIFLVVSLSSNLNIIIIEPGNARFFYGCEANHALFAGRFFE
jgi:hypothetical protein